MCQQSESELSSFLGAGSVEHILAEPETTILDMPKLFPQNTV